MTVAAQPTGSNNTAVAGTTPQAVGTFASMMGEGSERHVAKRSAGFSG